MVFLWDMISQIKELYGFKNKAVLQAMSLIPREHFVLEEYKNLAYDDTALSIGYQQTISQPYTVAFMTYLLNVNKNHKVLEIGTGSGYQAAVLSKLVREVYTIERIFELAKEANKRLRKLNFNNVSVKVGRGELGWKEKAPFDRIIVTAGVDNLPEGLFNQLKDEGILVAPVGEGFDKIMTKYIKKKNKIIKKEYGIFHFVPLVLE